MVKFTYSLDNLLGQDPVQDQCTNIVVANIFEAGEGFIQPYNDVSYALKYYLRSNRKQTGETNSIARSC
jgi:hypothetical protein